MSHTQVRQPAVALTKLLLYCDLKVGPEQWAQAHFFIGRGRHRKNGMNRQEAIAKVEQIARRVGDSEGIEVVEVELKGSGRQQVLRLVIDKPDGVTHGDCEFMTRQVGTILDVEDPIPGTYEMEVSSPGVERKLRTWKDWERFTGKPVKVVMKQPLVNAEGKEHKHFEGVIAGSQDQTIALDLPDGKQINFLFDQIDRAHLKFEW